MRLDGILMNTRINYKKKNKTAETIQRRHQDPATWLGMGDDLDGRIGGVLQKIKKSDLLLLTSLAEGLPNVVLEAMALGVPVVSTDCGGTNEVIHTEDTGILVSSMDPRSIADGVLQLVCMESAERKEIVNKAHDFVLNDFDFETCIEKFDKMYSAVISNQSK